MSNISQIKQQVNGIGEQAKTSAAQLNSMATNLEKNVAAINSAIGGTSQGEDKAMVAAFQQASKAVKEAAALLLQASTSAKEWAARA